MTTPYLTADQTSLFSPMPLKRGPTINNRFVLAPMTTTQSAADGSVLPAEYDWLVARAQGGFGLITTCASHVLPNGQGFPGQLGCFSDDLIDGLRQLASGIKTAGGVSSLQLHHAGIRAFAGVSDKVGPSSDDKTGARALEAEEIAFVIEAFVAAARRAERAGFDGVQVHGGHGYLITQFLSPELNRRSDGWGGSLANRARLLLEIVRGIREACGPDFQLGVRISPERFGMRLSEMLKVATMLYASDIDYLDLSIWDVTKEAEEEQYRGQTLASHFIALDRGSTRLGLAGKLMGGRQAFECLAMGADYAAIGKAGIVAHDLPQQVAQDPDFTATLPVTREQLAAQNVGTAFVEYLQGFNGIVSEG